MKENIIKCTQFMKKKILIILNAADWLVVFTWAKRKWYTYFKNEWNLLYVYNAKNKEPWLYKNIIE